MIASWRKAWHTNSGGLTDPLFPFGFCQLNGNGVGPPLGHATILRKYISLSYYTRVPGPGHHNSQRHETRQR